MKKEAVKEFLKFEGEMLSNPKTFFPAFEAGFKRRSDLIWQEYLEWQNAGGKPKEIEVRIIGEDKDILIWKLGNEGYAQKVDKLAPFSVEQYHQGLIAVLSFLQDRPQYYKFRNFEGMFNPLQLLLYKFL